MGPVFRVNDNATRYEGFCLGPVNTTAEDLEQRNQTVQYFSYPDSLWHQLREQAPGTYEAYADIATGQRTHLKLVITQGG